MAVELKLNIPDNDAALAAELCGEPRLVRQVARRAWLLRLAMRGLNAKEAAAIVGCSPAVVRDMYRDDNFKAEVKRRINVALDTGDEKFVAAQLTLAEKIRRKGDKAFEILCTLLEDPDVHPATRVRIAQDLLNRNEETQAGFQVTKKTFDTEKLRHAALVAAEMDGRVIPIRKEA